MYDSDACGKILASDINFAQYPNLEVAFAEPESLVYRSTVQLNLVDIGLITNQNYLTARQNNKMGRRSVSSWSLSGF